MSGIAISSQSIPHSPTREGSDTVGSSSNNDVDDEDSVDEVSFLNKPVSQQSLSSSANSTTENCILPITYSSFSSPLAPILLTKKSIGNHLDILEDERSTYMSVANACLLLNRFNCWGSSTPHIAESNLIDTQEYTSIISAICTALLNCASSHIDRRCRIISFQTLSTVARSSVAKLITTPLLFTNRVNMDFLTKIQDEICSDIVFGIVGCVLEEDDEDISSIAVESLSRIILDYDNDEWSQEIDMLTGVHDIPNQMTTETEDPVDRQRKNGGKTLLNVYQEIDPSSHLTELQWQIMESILVPRIRKIFCRICLFKSINNKVRCLPFLTHVMSFIIKTERSRRGDLSGREGREVFAKRWVEFDSTNLVREYIDLILIPLLRNTKGGIGVLHEQFTHSSEYAISVAMSALRLCFVIGHKQSWFGTVHSLAISNLQYSFTSMKGEQIDDINMMKMKQNQIASLLISLRVVRLQERVEPLALMATIVKELPSLRVVPAGVISPSILCDDGTRRKPLRMGFWVDMALSLLFPDDLSVVLDQGVSRSTGLKDFLGSAAVKSVLEPSLASKNVIHATYEVTVSFCSLSCLIGEWIIPHVSSKGDPRIDIPDDPLHWNNDGQHMLNVEADEWLRSALVLLETFALCLSGHSEQNYRGKSMSNCIDLYHAAYKSYFDLLVLTLVHSGMFMPSSSIYLHMICSIDSKNIECSYNAPFKNNTTSLNQLSLILSKIIEPCAKDEERLPRHRRISILTLLSDVWIHHCRSTIDSNRGGVNNENINLGPIDVDDDVPNIQEQHVRQILAAFAKEISNLIDEEAKKTSRTSNVGNNTDLVTIENEDQRHLLTCIACVESIAYTTEMWTSKFEYDNEVPTYLKSLCLLILKGQDKVEIGLDEGILDENNSASTLQRESATAPGSPSAKTRVTVFTSECNEASKRIQILHRGARPNLSPILNRYNEDFLETGDLRHTNLWNYYDELLSISYHQSHIEKLQARNTSNSEKSKQPGKMLLNVERRHHPNVSFHGSLVQLYRQYIRRRCEYAIRSSPLQALFSEEADITSTNGYYPSPLIAPNSYVPTNLKQNFVTIQPIPSMSATSLSFDRDQQLEMSNYNAPTTITGASDPLSVTLSYSKRRYARYDRECEWKMVVTMLVYNVTPVPIINGVKLDLCVEQKITQEDTLWSETSQMRQDDEIDNSFYESSPTFINVTTVYKNELAPGAHLLWEIVFDSWPCGDFNLCTYITLRELEAESSTYKVVHAYQQNSIDDSTDMGNDDCDIKSFNSGTVDTQLFLDEEFVEEEDTIDMTLVGVPINVSMMMNLQPCPLVFYRYDSGDEDVFWFLWLSMKVCLPEFCMTSNLGIDDGRATNKCIKKSKVTISSSRKNNIKAWAFSTWCGVRLLVAVISDFSNNQQIGKKTTVYIRSDDGGLIRSFIKCKLLDWIV